MALDMVATHSPKLQRNERTHEVAFLSPPKYVRKASADSILSGRRKLPKSPSRNSPLLDFTTSRPDYDAPNSADSESSLGTAKGKFDVFTFTDAEIELEGRITDKRISVLKSEIDIPNAPIGCLRKANSLSEFQDHPDLQQQPIIDTDSVSLSGPGCPSREDPSTPRGDLSPSNSYETIRRVQTFNDRQEKPAMELRRISTINLPPTDTCSIEFLLVPDLNIGSCLSMDGMGRSLDSEVWQETVSQEVNKTNKKYY
ncbi:hypothetical protein LOD99_15409 [Oopsacas minuta]|uniref:Uncharacterized protein n=1 Tax=Oopsacas minuta TaxID=111878 RepID=A0AAV7KAY2_9METZ|nr:hypothetical protein LOD99_15409 [Oopsacas minuta]